MTLSLNRSHLGRRLAGVLVGAALLTLAACNNQSVPNQQATTQATAPTAAPEPSADVTQRQLYLEAQAGPPKVGLILPLTGQHRLVGQALSNAAQLALFDLAGSDFTLLIRDSGGTPDGARQAAREVLTEGASLILGPLFGASVAGVAEEAGLADVPVITFSNDSAVAAPNVYVFGISPSEQIDRVMGFAAGQGFLRFGALVPRSAYGDRIVAGMRLAAERYFVEVSRIGYYAPDGSDLNAQVREFANYDSRLARSRAQAQQLYGRSDEAALQALARIEEQALAGLDYETVIIPEGGLNLLTAAPLLAYYDVNPTFVRFLGSQLWDDLSLGTEPTLQGGWFAAPDPANWLAFQQRYQATFGGLPPRIATLGYDATAMAAILAQQIVAAGKPFSFQALTQDGGFAGQDGIFRLLADGRTERGMAILEVQRDHFVVVDPAPTSFAPPVF